MLPYLKRKALARRNYLVWTLLNVRDGVVPPSFWGLRTKKDLAPYFFLLYFNDLYAIQVVGWFRASKPPMNAQRQ
jgi:hypothetical protein